MKKIDKSGQAVAKRAKREKWFWICNLPVVFLLYLWAYGLEFKPVGIMILYLALVSVHALIKTCATEEQAAEARKD